MMSLNKLLNDTAKFCKTVEAEMATLKARLPEPYRSNVAQLQKMAKEQHDAIMKEEPYT